MDNINTKCEIVSFILDLLRKRLNDEMYTSIACKSRMILDDELPIFIRVKRKTHPGTTRLAEVIGIEKRSLVITYCDTGTRSKVTLASCGELFMWNFTTAEAIDLAKKGYIVHHQRRRIFLLSKTPPHIIIVYNESLSRTRMPRDICKEFGTFTDGWTIRTPIGKDKSYDLFLGRSRKVGY